MTKNQRMSNFELLRIVAMVLIIIHHLVVHCFEVQLTTESSIQQFNNGWYNNPVFYPILFLPEIFNPLGKAGVAIFMLLSGYFLVERGKTVNLGKIASKLLGMIAFAVVLVTVGITVWQAIHPDPDIKLPIFELHAYNWWFVGYYLIAVIAGKVWLNGYLSNASREAYFGFVAALAGLIFLQFSFSMIAGLSIPLPTALCGVFLYLLGGYIKKYDPFGKIRTPGVILAFVLLCGTVFLIYRNNFVNALQEYQAGGESEGFRQHVLSFTETDIIPIFMGITIFELFRRIRIPANRFINYLGNASFMVYLIHDLPYIRAIWNRTDFVTMLHESPLRFCLTFLMWVAIVYAAGTLAYLLYRGILKAFRAVKQ